MKLKSDFSLRVTPSTFALLRLWLGSYRLSSGSSFFLSALFGFLSLYYSCSFLLCLSTVALSHSFPFVRRPFFFHISVASPKSLVGPSRWQVLAMITKWTENPRGSGSETGKRHLSRSTIVARVGERRCFCPTEDIRCQRRSCFGI